MKTENKVRAHIISPKGEKADQGMRFSCRIWVLRR